MYINAINVIYGLQTLDFRQWGTSKITIESSWAKHKKIPLKKVGQENGWVESKFLNLFIYLLATPHMCFLKIEIVYPK